MIEVRNLHYSVAGEQLVGPCHFSLDSPQVMGIVGPNGSGKSTLLKVLSGDVADYEGECLLEGQSVELWDSRALAKRRAVVNQFNEVSFPFTVAEVVEMGRSPFSDEEPRSDIRNDAMRAMRCMDIQSLSSREYSSLSGGEKQRTAIARGICQIGTKPDGVLRRYLYLDEPTASLDLKYQHRLLAFTRTLTSLNVIVIVVLHDLNLAARYCDSLLMTKKNAGAIFGPTEKVLTKDRITSTFDVEVDEITGSAGERIIHVTGAFLSANDGTPSAARVV